MQTTALYQPRLKLLMKLSLATMKLQIKNLALLPKTVPGLVNPDHCSNLPTTDLVEYESRKPLHVQIINQQTLIQAGTYPKRNLQITLFPVILTLENFPSVQWLVPTKLSKSTLSCSL